MSLHRFLSISSSAKAQKVVPKLQDITLKAGVHISDDSLLQYQHDLRTNSTYFNINLLLDPTNSDISAFQQFFIVNGLCGEFIFELDYDESIIEAADDEDAREALLVEHAENICNERISRELHIAEQMLNADATGFFDSVAEKVDHLLAKKIDPETIESGQVPLTVYKSNVYLEWAGLIEPCIRELIAGAGLDADDLSLNNPFELIDLNKVKTLGSLFGELYEESLAWSPYRIQLRKYQIGSAWIGHQDNFSEEQIKSCLAHCAASFFVNVTKTPIGRKYIDSTSVLRERFIRQSQDYYDTVATLRLERKRAAAKHARRHAAILVDEIGVEAERLKLALDQELPFQSIFHEILTNYVRIELEENLQQRLKELYDSKAVRSIEAVNFVDSDWDRFIRGGGVVVSGSPQLLTLRASQIASEFFEDHAWLGKLDIKKPEISLLADEATRSHAGDAAGNDEYILIQNWFTDGARPKYTDLIIDMEKVLLDVNQEPTAISTLSSSGSMA